MNEKGLFTLTFLGSSLGAPFCMIVINLLMYILLIYIYLLMYILILKGDHWAGLM